MSIQVSFYRALHRRQDDRIINRQLRDLMREATKNTGLTFHMNRNEDEPELHDEGAEFWQYWRTGVLRGRASRKVKLKVAERIETLSRRGTFRRRPWIVCSDLIHLTVPNPEMK